MFPSCLFRSPLLLSSNPVLPTSLVASQNLNRLLGKHAPLNIDCTTLSNILQKVPKNSLPFFLASAGYGFSWLQMGNTHEALDIANSILSSDNKIPEDIISFVHHLKFYALKGIFRNAVTYAEHFSENHSNISGIKEQFREIYHILSQRMSSCPFLKMTYAEFLLYDECSSQSLDLLSEVCKDLSSFTQPNGGSNNPSWIIHLESNAFQRIAFASQQQQALVALERLEMPIANQSKLIENPMDSELIQHDLNTAKDILSVKDLNTDEVIQLAYIKNILDTSWHPHTLFKPYGPYLPWNSEHANHARMALYSAMGISEDGIFPPLDSFLKQEKNKVSTPIFYGNIDKLQKALNISRSSQKSILQVINEEVGKIPESDFVCIKTPLDKSQSSIEGYPISPLFAGSENYSMIQWNIINELNAQMLARNNTFTAFALAEMGRHHEALDILSSILHENKYIEMWRVLLGRGSIRKSLGLIKDSESDFSACFSLKRPYDRVSIPLYNSYTKKVTF